MTTATSSTIQRFTPSSPCPVCGGSDHDRRGHGIRCWGFLSSDRRYAHCTRDEYAGGLARTETSETYAHLIEGECRCGIPHDPSAAGGGAVSTSRRTLRNCAPSEPAGPIIAAYDYCDPDTGAVLYQVTRHEPKTFRQRHRTETGAWEWGLNGTKRILYRLPELRAADPWAPIFIPEGEKDVDRLRDLGLEATCNSEGAGKWRPEHSEELRGRAIIALKDNDQAGEKHTADVARDSLGIAASVRVLALPGLPPGGDVSDWLDAGGTREELLALAAATPPIMPDPTLAAAPCSDEVAYWKERAVRAEGMVEEMREIAIDSLALRRNKALKTIASTIEAIGNECASIASRGQVNEDGGYTIRRWVLAENNGRSEQAVSDHLGKLNEWGALRKENRTVWQQQVHRDTGELIDLPHQEIRITLPKPPREWVKMMTSFTPPEGTPTHGGRRVSLDGCHPGAPIVRKDHCGICDAVLEADDALLSQDDSIGIEPVQPPVPASAADTPMSHLDSIGAESPDEGGDCDDGPAWAPLDDNDLRNCAPDPNEDDGEGEADPFAWEPPPDLPATLNGMGRCPRCRAPLKRDGTCGWAAAHPAPVGVP
jgi:hypothetical protein